MVYPNMSSDFVIVQFMLRLQIKLKYKEVQILSVLDATPLREYFNILIQFIKGPETTLHVQLNMPKT